MASVYTIHIHRSAMVYLMYTPTELLYVCSYVRIEQWRHRRRTIVFAVIGLFMLVNLMNESTVHCNQL